MIASTRVVPPDMHKGVVLTTAVACILASIPWYLLYMQYFMDAMYHSIAAFVLIVLWPVIVPLIGMSLVAATSQRLRTMILVGIAGLLSLLCVATLLDMMLEGTSHYDGEVFLAGLLSAAVIAGVGAVQALLIHYFTRLFIVRTVAQTGSLCWTCAYDLSATAPDHPCPECGTNPATNRPRRYAIIRLVRTLTAPARRLQTLCARNKTPKRQKPAP